MSEQTTVAEEAVPFSQWANARTHGTPKAKEEKEQAEPVVEEDKTAQAAPATQTESGKPETTEDTKHLDEAEDADLAADPEALKNPAVRKHLGGYAKVKLQRDKARTAAENNRLEVERLKGQLEALKAPAPKTVEKPVEAKPEPKPEEFTTVDAYYKALVEHQVEQRVAAALSSREQSKAEQDKKAAEDRRRTEVSTGWETQVKDTIADPEFADWRDVVMKPGVAFPDFLSQAIYELDHGPKVAYKLAEDPELLQKIGTLSPARAIAELGKLSAKFDVQPEVKTEVPPTPKPQRSNAPLPIRPSSSPTQTSVQPDDEIPFSQWAVRRNQKVGNH